MRLPLGRLIQRLREHFPHADACEIERSRGYGAQVNGWDAQLDGKDTVVVGVALLLHISAGCEDWFYDFEATIPGCDVRFGLHDSTALFVEGESSLVESVVRGFRDVRLTVPPEVLTDAERGGTMTARGDA